MRTKKDFDKWFRESKGDPWGYDSELVNIRFNKSIDFLTQHISQNDVILECGCFKGQFTKSLATNFSENKIIAFDISEYAIEHAKEKVDFKNVSFFDADILKINNSWVGEHCADGENSCVVMMEVLYYLDYEDRKQCVKMLSEEFPKSKIVISTPIVGNKYFSEESLIELFSAYRLVSSEVVSLKRNFLFLNKVIMHLTKKIKFLHNFLVNQKIFVFYPL